MSFSRRGIFGFLAGAPVAAAAVKASAVEPAPAPSKPQFFVGQIRVAVSHYEARPFFDGGHTHTLYHPSLSSHTHTLAGRGYYTTSVAMHRYEQWNGTEWLPIAPPQERDRT